MRCVYIFFSRIDSVLWFITKFLVSAYFLWLAKKWPTLMGEWERIEHSFPAYVGQKRAITFFSFKIKLCAILIVLGLFSWVSLQSTLFSLKVYCGMVITASIPPPHLHPYTYATYILDVFKIHYNRIGNNEAIYIVFFILHLLYIAISLCFHF